MGRTEPTESGIQSIWFLKTAVWGCVLVCIRRSGVDVGWRGAYEIPMLLGRDPDMAVAPAAEVAKLLDFGVVVLDVVFHGEAGWVEDADVAAESEEDAGGFERE